MNLAMKIFMGFETVNIHTGSKAAALRNLRRDLAKESQVGLEHG